MASRNSKPSSSTELVDRPSYRNANASRSFYEVSKGGRKDVTRESEKPRSYRVKSNVPRVLRTNHFILSSKAEQLTHRRKLAEHILNNFHFRVVENVYAEKPPPITMGVPIGTNADGSTKFVEIPTRIEYAPTVIKRTFEGMQELFEPEDIDQLDEDAFDKNIVVIPWSFTGITQNTDTVFRTRVHKNPDYNPKMEDPYEGHPIIFSSAARSEFNPYTFTFDEIAKDHFPLAGDGVRMPEVGDVIAYFPTSESMMDAYIDRTEREDLAGETNYAPKPLQADAWFVCSFQLLRTLAMIAFGPSHSLLKAGTKGKYSIARHWLFQSNRLRTNKLLERIFAYSDSGVEFDPKLPEISCLYTCSRMESTYLNWVHLYPAIILMISYGIYPSDENVPQTLDQEGTPCKINMKHWHIPDNYVTEFVKRWMN